MCWSIVFPSINHAPWTKQLVQVTTQSHSASFRDNHHTSVHIGKALRICQFTLCVVGSRFNKINHFYISSKTFLVKLAFLYLQVHTNEEHSDYQHLLLPLPWFRLQHFYPTLFLHHECKYQCSEKGKWCLSIMKIIWPPEKVSANCRPSFENFKLYLQYIHILNIYFTIIKKTSTILLLLIDIL